jgi:excisionase family DNA binding protein
MLGAKQIFTIGEVALLAGVSEKTVRGAIHAGELVALRFNSRLVRIQRAAVERWLDACTTRARCRVVRSDGTGGTSTSSRNGHKSA